MRLANRSGLRRNSLLLPAVMTRKLILRCPLAPGDLVLLSAAIRDLHRTYPDRFLTDVRTCYPDIWKNNPYVTRLLETTPGVESLDCHYPLIDDANRLPFHALHGFKDFLNQTLGLNVQLTEFKGDIHLSAEEKSWMSQVHELVGRDIPFWIIAAGGKYDYTIKWWDNARFQEVVDHFRGRIQFVQVGQVGDYHPRLNGVIDLRGRTDLRQLIRLVYHSQGVLCPVTFLMHLAAAVETNRGMPRRRACVVVAGGREPAHWEAYPHHQFIHTNGALHCCAQGGCWRARTFPLGDGRSFDRPSQLCKNVEGHLPRCMHLITAKDVIERIEYYFAGGSLRFLTRDEYAVCRKATRDAANGSSRRLGPREYTYDDVVNPYTARGACEAFIKTIKPYPAGFSGRGIVICAGGFRYFTAAWVCINMLRRLGCRLPIQVWHLDASEMGSDMRKLLEPLGVECVDASQVRKEHPTRTWGGWELKPFAIAHCSFREVLLLDADNVPLVNPEFLFETPEYRQHGAIFWPDIWRCKPSKDIWRIVGIPFRRGFEFESGQIVMDKQRCWRALSLTLWFNEHSDFFYRHVLGDKETFHLAFRKLEQPFAMPSRPVKRLTATMCQHDFQGRRIFQHRNLDKWNLWLHNRRIKGFRFETECRALVQDLRSKWDGRMAACLRELGPPKIPLAKVNSPPSIVAVMVSCAPRDNIRRATLRRLAATDWGRGAVEVFRDPSPAPSDPGRSMNTGIYNALAFGVRSKADYILLLEDDLAFNRHLRHNLENWAPLARGEITLGSVYNPTLGVKAIDAENQCFVADPDGIYGSQAYIISRATAAFILRSFDRVPSLPDVKISRLAEKLQRPILYHVPSLVQHVGRISVWGGDFHHARDFNPRWRARPLHPTS